MTLELSRGGRDWMKVRHLLERSRWTFKGFSLNACIVYFMLLSSAILPCIFRRQGHEAVRPHHCYDKNFMLHIMIPTFLDNICSWRLSTV
ncbi:hypothetical protein BDR04DRAFT_1102534 [Suillus decipiens]|nr:hypothetical protein BDR04DRAFT_1102534 [Suillus decipiens]